MGLFTKKKIENEVIESTINAASVTETPTVTSKISNDVIEQINSLKGTSSDISSSINDVSNSVKALTNATVSQNHEIDTATNILRDFSDNMEKLAYNVTNVQIKVYDTDELSDTGIESIEKLDSSLNDLQSAFTVSNSTVNDLVSKLESVNTITDSISQIAAQTNLLSLNAAIEAARAGEAGKGFSVVAGEVRKLADNSKQAVQSITKILDEIKKDIINASNAMDAGTDAINTQQETLNETKSSFQNIKSSIHEATEEINDFIENLAVTSAQKDDVLSAVEKANSISQEYTALAEEIAATIDIESTTIEEFDEHLSTLADKFIQ